MRKITLDMDALNVESFDTTERGWNEWGMGPADASGFRTNCGDCLSGPYPCEQSYAITDGVAVCQCCAGTGSCTD